MPNLIQVADDLKGMPDQWLAQQAEQPSGSVPPYLVVAELARRERMRTSAAKQQQQSSVSDDLIRSLYAKVPPTAGLAPAGPGTPPPGTMVPPGMPAPNLSPGSGAMGPAAPGTPPANMRVPGPPRMAAGGMYDEEETPDEAEDPLDNYVLAAAQKYELRPELLRSMIKHESSGNVKARSPKGARGAMQIMPDTARGMGADPEQLDDPAVNIDTGARYLRQLLDKYGDERKAVMAYNMGPGALDRREGAPYRETDVYANKVMGTGSAMQQNLSPAGPPLARPPAATTSRLLPEAGPGAEQLKRTANAIRQGGSPGTQPAALGSRLLRPQEQPPGTEALFQALNGADPQQRVQPQQAAAGMPGAGADENAQLEAAAGLPPKAAPEEVQAEMERILTEPVPAANPTAAPGSAEEPGTTTPDAQQPLHQTWQPTATEVKALEKQMDRIQNGHLSADKRLRDLFGDENLQLLNKGARLLIGPPQDYSKYAKAIDETMAIAKQQMHPSIGDTLIAFGSALMASPAHNFGQALGQANLASIQYVQKMKQQGAQDYMAAIKSGVALQDKIDDYNAKIGQYKMQRLGVQQAGVMQDERTFQSQLTTLQNKVDKAQADFDKRVSTPNVQQLQAMAFLNRKGVQFDPKVGSPLDQLSRDFPSDREALQIISGKTAAATKATPGDQQLESAIRETAKSHGVTLPPGPVTLQSLPQQFQKEANELFANYAAQRTVSAQTQIADLAAKDLDPEIIGPYIAQYQKLPPGIANRSALLAGKAWAMGKQWLAAHGMTAMEAYAAKNMADANKGALVELNKMHVKVDAFSQLAERNMNLVETISKQIEDLGAPALNAPVRSLAAKYAGDRRVAAFQAAIVPVQAEIARVLGSANAQGVVNMSDREEMRHVLSPDYTVGQLVDALNVFRREIQGRREIYNASVQELVPQTVVTGVKGQQGQQQAAPAAPQEEKQANGWVWRKGADGQWHAVRRIQ